MASNPYRIHAFVCLGGKTCPAQGSEEIWRQLKARVKELGLAEEIRISKSGCVGQCGYGPMACVYPDGVWYAGLTEGDIEPLLAHLRAGTPHAPRLYEPETPGNNKRPVTDS